MMDKNKKMPSKKKKKTNYKLKINNDNITDDKQVAELFTFKMKRTLNENFEEKFNDQFRENTILETENLLGEFKKKKKRLIR